MTHICVSKLTITGSDNGLSPGRRQAIIWTNAGILFIRSLGTNFSEILSEIHIFSFKDMHLKMSSAKWRQFCVSQFNFPVPEWAREASQCCSRSGWRQIFDQRRRFPGLRASGGCWPRCPYKRRNSYCWRWRWGTTWDKTARSPTSVHGDLQRRAETIC